jgi:hypothetical protein
MHPAVRPLRSNTTGRFCRKAPSRSAGRLAARVVASRPRYDRRPATPGPAVVISQVQSGKLRLARALIGHAQNAIYGSDRHSHCVDQSPHQIGGYARFVSGSILHSA